MYIIIYYIYYVFFSILCCTFVSFGSVVPRWDLTKIAPRIAGKRGIHAIIVRWCVPYCAMVKTCQNMSKHVLFSHTKRSFPHLWGSYKGSPNYGWPGLLAVVNSLFSQLGNLFTSFFSRICIGHWFPPPVPGDDRGRWIRKPRVKSWFISPQKRIVIPAWIGVTGLFINEL